MGSWEYATTSMNSTCAISSVGVVAGLDCGVDGVAELNLRSRSKAVRGPFAVGNVIGEQGWPQCSRDGRPTHSRGGKRLDGGGCPGSRGVRDPGRLLLRMPRLAMPPAGREIRSAPK